MTDTGKRDPRLDPQPGDVLRDAHGNIRTVVPRWYGASEVCFAYRPGYELSTTMNNWHCECATAEIVKVSDA